MSFITRQIVDLGDGCCIIEPTTDDRPYITFYGQSSDGTAGVVCYAGLEECRRLALALALACRSGDEAAALARDLDSN